MKETVVSDNAIEYFKLNNITPIEWINYCQKMFNLKNGDVVFYIGNKIGYKINNYEKERNHTRS
jgi:hypothetical protein